MNLGASCPIEPEKFKIIVETAGHDESTRSKARLRFKKYKEYGIGLSSRKIEDITEVKILASDDGKKNTQISPNREVLDRITLK